jgi:DNA modification methylase
MAQKAGSLVYAAACGDCRDIRAVRRLLGGRKVNLVVTSPPYASQRKYDASSGFKPIAPDEYVSWFKDVAAVIGDVLDPDGSYFLNIKEHAEDGERSLYVKDLVLAHRRQWGWKFVDEFCWRNTANGVPGGWPNRFKNAWEPVFHFTRSDKIKFRPDAVSHASDDVVVYSPSNPKAPSGSGLLGCGADKVKGMARPSNVIEVKAEGGQGEHSAPYPRALVEFFIKAFTDPGDVVFDPFLGSASTMIAAMALGRSCFGMEISPGYCDVAVQRAQTLAKKPFLLAGCGATFEQVKLGRRLGQEDAIKEELEEILATGGTR